MLVWRIEEREDRYGPYIAGYMDDYKHSQQRPKPVLDGIDGWQTLPEPRFGCASIEALLEWFTIKELIHFAQAGLVVAEYRVEQAILGKRQVAFSLDTAERLAEYNPCELLGHP